MSRDFDGSTGDLALASGSAGHLRISLPVTIAAWVNPDTLKVCGIFTNNKTGATHSGVWFDIGDTSGNLEINFGSNIGSGSTSRRSKGPTGATASLTTGVWQHVAARVRGATDMDMLINAVDVGGTYSGSGGSVAYSTTRSAVAGAVGGANFFDGRIAEVGFWSVSLSDLEILALAKGVSPLRIRRGSLLCHLPVYGQASPEADLSGLSTGFTLEGTAALANHAPVGPPFPIAA